MRKQLEHETKRQSFLLSMTYQFNYYITSRIKGTIIFSLPINLNEQNREKKQNTTTRASFLLIVNGARGPHDPIPAAGI